MKKRESRMDTNNYKTLALKCHIIGILTTILSNRPSLLILN